MMINNVTLVGRLTKDVVVRLTPSNKKVCSFTLAVDRRKKDENQSADFIPCVIWEKGAEILERYTHKGSQIGVVGQIQTRNYDDPNYAGRKVFVTEVLVSSVMLLGSKEQSAPVVETQNDYNDFQIDMDDLPF